MMKIHSTAVEAAIESARPALTAVDEPLIELARTLAAQMDAAGPDGPGTRLAAAYLTTVRELTARLSKVPSVKKTGKLHELRADLERQRSA
jgi:hypothetical protein